MFALDRGWPVSQYAGFRGLHRIGEALHLPYGTRKAHLPREIRECMTTPVHSPWTRYRSVWLETRPQVPPDRAMLRRLKLPGGCRNKETALRVSGCSTSYASLWRPGSRISSATCRRTSPVTSGRLPLKHSEMGEHILQMHHVRIFVMHVEQVHLVGKGRTVECAFLNDAHMQAGGKRIDHACPHAT